MKTSHPKQKRGRDYDFGPALAEIEYQMAPRKTKSSSECEPPKLSKILTEVSEKYHIVRSTLLRQYKKFSNPNNVRRCGPPSLLAPYEVQLLEKWVHFRRELLCAPTVQEIRYKVMNCSGFLLYFSIADFIVGVYKGCPSYHPLIAL